MLVPSVLSLWPHVVVYAFDLSTLEAEANAGV